jgi:hypothetical protein
VSRATHGAQESCVQGEGQQVFSLQVSTEGAHSATTNRTARNASHTHWLRTIARLALLWLTTTSFLRTLAHKRRSSLAKVARSLKQGVNRYVVTHQRKDGTSRDYVLVSSTKYLERKPAASAQVDNHPNTWLFRGRTELGQRLEANQCEWCGTQTGRMEVHHVRKLKDLHGKTLWERTLIARQRKTLVLCRKCHVDLHAGRLTEATKRSENRRAGYMETCTSGSEGSSVKPITAM